MHSSYERFWYNRLSPSIYLLILPGFYSLGIVYRCLFFHWNTCFETAIESYFGSFSTEMCVITEEIARMSDWLLWIEKDGIPGFTEGDLPIKPGDEMEEGVVAWTQECGGW